MGIFSRNKKDSVSRALASGQASVVGKPNFSVSFEAFLESYKIFRRSIEVLDAYVRERAEYQEWKKQNPEGTVANSPNAKEWWREGGWAKARSSEPGVNQ
jgi:hypothetical protein